MPEFFRIIANERSRRRLLAAWAMDGASAGARALFGWDGARYEPIYRDAAFPAALLPEGEGLLEYMGTRVFVEQISGGRRLVVCGAGHVALNVIRLGAMLGFGVTVIEDREAFAERAKEAGAERVICAPFAEALDAMEGGPLTAFVVMTREHVHDVECLRRILKKPWAYAGMMGSRSRSASIRRNLLDEGFDPGRVEAVRMPIGLSIGARTPEEIAVSVMAELIAVINGIDTGEGFPPGMLEALTAPGAAAVLAIIVEKTGEAPRRPGTRLLVRADGSFMGTVGGGYAEAVLLKTAAGMLREGCRESRLVRVSMKKGALQCGGEIAVLLIPCEAGTPCPARP